ncbi:MAG: type III-A CRISPR-associated RAMP protein Csm3 [Candidatus Aenigmatarchaeota archaeon]
MVKNIKIPIKIRAETGLRIGGEKETFEIGGLDNPIIKTVKIGFTEKRIPIIPGSSLKGRVRSIIEEYLGITEIMKKAYNELLKKGEEKNFPSVINNDKDLDSVRKRLKIEDEKIINEFDKNVKKIWKIFGKGEAKEESGKGIAIFTDLYPTKETLEKWNDLYEKDLTFDLGTELKMENVINRITGTAEHPRKMERVIPGSEFEGFIILNFEKDNLTDEDKELVKLLITGLRRLEEYYYLGGSGTRGYGRVKIFINNISITEKSEEEIANLILQNALS